MDQKKYKKVGRNFKSSLMLGIALTVGAMTFAPATANAQSIGDGVKKEAVEEINKTAKDFISGIFEGIRHSGKESRTTRDTRVTAEQSAEREAIINGSGSGNMGQGGMVSQRSMTVTSSNEDGTVRSTVKSDNRTAAQIAQQRQRDQYNMERQIIQAEVQKEIQRIRSGQDEQANEQLALLQAQNEALRLQLEAMQLQQEQQNKGGSTYYQPSNNGAGTTTTLSERDQQMLQNCKHMQDNGATVLPDNCNNLLNTTFQITTRR